MGVYLNSKSPCLLFQEEASATYFVDKRYLKEEGTPKISREGLRLWYDGYQTASGRRLYNPQSVVAALSDNQLGSYWTSSGPYDETDSSPSRIGS